MINVTYIHKTMKRLRWWLATSLLCLTLLPMPVETAAPAGTKTQNIILITFDGLRWQEVFTGADSELLNKENGGVQDTNQLRSAFWRETPEERRAALLPFLWGVVAKEGQIFGNQKKGSVAKVTNGLKFSYPGYNEILAGFPDARINTNNKGPNPNSTVLEWLNKKPAYQQRIAAFCSWDAFADILNRGRSGLMVKAGREPMSDGKLNPRQALLNQLIQDITSSSDNAVDDPLTFYSALEYLKEHRPRVLYLAFNETDEWAHDKRYDRLLQAAHRIDRYIRTLWETAQAMPDYRGKTTLIITTDHGRGDGPVQWKSHGKETAGSENIWIAFLGPDTPPLGERTQTAPVTQAQIAATLAALLGEDYQAAVPQAGPVIRDVCRGPR